MFLTFLYFLYDKVDLYNIKTSLRGSVTLKLATGVSLAVLSLLLTACIGTNNQTTEISNYDVEELYSQGTCLNCHGEDLEGGAGPALTEVGSELSHDEIFDIIISGKAFMKPNLLEEKEAELVASWLAKQK